MATSVFCRYPSVGSKYARHTQRLSTEKQLPAHVRTDSGRVRRGLLGGLPPLRFDQRSAGRVQRRSSRQRCTNRKVVVLRAQLPQVDDKQRYVHGGNTSRLRFAGLDLLRRRRGYLPPPGVVDGNRSEWNRACVIVASLFSSATARMFHRPEMWGGAWSWIVIVELDFDEVDCFVAGKTVVIKFHLRKLNARAFGIP